MKTKNKSFKRLFAFLVALVMVTALVPSVIFAADPTFPDVPTTHWAYDYIEKLAKAEIIGGYADGTFGPEDNVTRQQAAKMIAGAADLTASTGFISKFIDLDKVAAELKPYVLALEEYEVVGGFADGSFGPTLNIKRSQAAKMIVNAFGLAKGELDVKFADPVADAADQAYIDILASNGIVKGYTEDGKQLFKPYDLVTRAQLTKMIDKAMDWELEVFKVSVKAQTVDIGGSLTFSINGGEEIKASDLVGSGYTVEFAASKGVFLEEDKVGTALVSSTTGKLNSEKTKELAKSATTNKFDFQVVIKDSDSEVIATSALAVATIQNFALNVTQISSVKTLLEVEEFDDQEITDGKLALGDDEAKIEVKGFIKGGKKAINLVTSELVEFTSNRPGVLEVDNATGVIKIKAKGTATVTIKAGTQTKTVTYTVGNARVASAANSTIDKKAVTIATGDTFKLTVQVKDQYGMPFSPSAVGVRNLLTGSAIVNVTPVAQDAKVKGKYVASVKAKSSATKGDVEVDADGVQLGKVAVTVKAAADTVASYGIEIQEPASDKFDLKSPSDNSRTLLVKSYDKDGLKIADISVDGTNFKFVSKSTAVAMVSGNTVTLAATAKAGDSVVIELYEIVGGIDYLKKTITLTVVDTTPSFTVEFFSVADIKANKTIAIADIVDITLSSEEDVFFADFESGSGKMEFHEEKAAGVKLGYITLTKTKTGTDATLTGTNLVVNHAEPTTAFSDLLTISVFDVNNNFLGQTQIKVAIPKSN